MKVDLSAGLAWCCLLWAGGLIVACGSKSEPEPAARPKPAAKQEADAATTGQATTGQATTGQASESKRETTYRHALGLSFPVPSAWQVRQTDWGLQVLPDDAEPFVNVTDAKELYLVAMYGADPSVANLDDPRVGSYLDAAMQRLQPSLRRRGKAEDVAGVPGRRFVWVGRGVGGGPVICRVHGRLLGGYFLSVLAAGEEKRVEGRSTGIHRLVAGLDLAAPRTSARFAGTWHARDDRSTGRVGDRLHVTHSQTVTLLADGRATSAGQTSFAGSGGRDGAGQPAYTVTGLSDIAREQGRWGVQGDQLYILWKATGVAKFGCYVQGGAGRREMLLTTPAGRKILWTEYAD